MKTKKIEFSHSNYLIINSESKVIGKFNAPKNINIKSDAEQTKQTKKICCFFKPCSITKIFCAPIAKIRLRPVKNPKIRNSIQILVYSAFAVNVLISNIFSFGSLTKKVSCSYLVPLNLR